MSPPVDAPTSNDPQWLHYCSKCSYILHGGLPLRPCPECGSTQSTQIQRQDYIQNDQTRRFWIGHGLLLIQIALTFELAIAALKIIFTVAGLGGPAQLVGICSLSIWFLLIALGTLALYYGITRVYTTGHCVFFRSLLMAAFSALATLSALQFLSIFSSYFGSHVRSFMLLDLQALPPFLGFLVAGFTTIAFMLHGVKLAHMHLGIPLRASRILLLQITWGVLCVLSIATLKPVYSTWNPRIAPISFNQGQPIPPAMVANPPRVIYGIGSCRVQNAHKFNRLLRVDAGPTFWAELIATGVYHTMVDLRLSSSSLGTSAYLSRPRLSREVDISFNEARFIWFKYYAPPAAGAAVPPPPSWAIDILWLDLLWVFLGGVLSFYFAIALWFTVRDLRRVFNKVIP